MNTAREFQNVVSELSCGVRRLLERNRAAAALKFKVAATCATIVKFKPSDASKFLLIAGVLQEQIPFASVFATHKFQIFMRCTALFKRNLKIISAYASLVARCGEVWIIEPKFDAPSVLGDGR